jgi:hypothetical protein
MTMLRTGRTIMGLSILAVAIPLLLLAAGSDRQKSADAQEQPAPEFARIVDQVVARERECRKELEGYTPRVETYIQYYKPERELGDVPRKDVYFLGRLKFSTKKVQSPTVTKGDSGETKAEENYLLRQAAPNWFIDAFKPELHMDEFAVEPLVVDEHNFDRNHYTFDPVRWEYLGDFRCLSIDVHPRDRHARDAFEGRIWVEDHDYSIVRLNGTRLNPPFTNFYVHFDCWRENLQPGQWMPVYIYSQESDIGKRLRYMAETRLWGYDLSVKHQQQEWTNVSVEAPAPLRDSSEQQYDMSPLESERKLTMDAENNVLDRLEKARLVAPRGPVDHILETVVNNLRVTNHLDNLPPIQCRVMLTSSLESFSLAYSIVISRGLIDVLPDEGSLAMVLAHELAHIALGHKMDTKYAFNDRLQISDEYLLSILDFSRTPSEEAAADAKGLEFLKNSPYKDNLKQAGLFLRAAVATAPQLKHLFGPHLGEGLTYNHNKMTRMEELLGGAPQLMPRNVSQVSALPLGSRVQVNAWDGTIIFTNRKAIPLVDASEKMPFQVTPVVPYLKAYSQKSSDIQATANQ